MGGDVRPFCVQMCCWGRWPMDWSQGYIFNFTRSKARTKTGKYEFFFFFFWSFFLLFLGPLPRHMEVPRLGVKSEL